MKTIYLVRHAKSEWANDNLIDFDRPLNARGYRDANEMSLFLKEKNILPDSIITSPAIRAISTALIFSRNFNFNASEIVIKPSLYNSTAKHYLHVISQVDDHYKSIMLFGHNPSITDLANILTSRLTENIPTCGVIGISNGIKHWNEIAEGELTFCHFPKK